MKLHFWGCRGVGCVSPAPLRPPFCISRSADLAPSPLPHPRLVRAAPRGARAPLRAPSLPHPRGFAFPVEGEKLQKNPLFHPPPPGGSNPRRSGFTGGMRSPPAPSGKLRCQARPRRGPAVSGPFNGSIIRC